MKSEKECPEEEQTVKMRGRECAVMMWDTSERRQTCLKVAISMNSTFRPSGTIPEKGSSDHRKEKRSNGARCSRDWKLALELPTAICLSLSSFCLSNLLPALDFPVWQTNHSISLALYCFFFFFSFPSWWLNFLSGLPLVLESASGHWPLCLGSEICFVYMSQ